MSEFEAEDQEQSQERPDRPEWLGGEAMVSFHRRSRIWDMLRASSRCNSLTMLLVFSAGVLIGGTAAGWRPFRSGGSRRS